jgi:hypothetical protein
MGGGSGIGVVVLTTLMGGVAAFGLSFFLIWFLNVSNFEGGAGYFTLFVTLTGVVGGFVIGLITALTMRSSFAQVQLRAAAIVLALTIAAGVIAVLGKVFEDEGPKLEGDSIRLEVELKCPRDWKPDNALKAGHGGCWIQKYPKNGPLETNPIVSGSLTWDNPPAPGEPWAISCAVPLEKTASPRYMLIYTSEKFDVTLRVPLPRHPGPEFKQWSAWTIEGFLPQSGSPVSAAGLAFRFRAIKESDYSAAHPSKDEAFKQAREKALAGMPPTPTVADWLPFYENVWEVPTYPQDIRGPEVAAVNAHPEELLPLLRSEDMTTVRRAIWATTFLKSVPPSLIEPLAHGGLLTINLIRAARAAALPNDPDELTEDKASSFFTYWSMAMDHAGASASSRHVLEQIAAELASGPLDEKLERLAGSVKQTLEKLSQAK